MTSPPGASMRIQQVALMVTVVFTVCTVLAVFVNVMRPVTAVVSGVLFVVGCVAYLAGYAQIVRRSRSDQIEVGGFVFLSGSAPRPIRQLLLGSTAVQTVVAVAGAGARPFTLLAFGILAPMFGLGLQAWWASRYGTFPKRGAATGRGQP